MTKFVVDQAVTGCSCGTMPSALLVSGAHRWDIESKHAANITDHIPIKNILPFGLCKSMANPAVAAAQGTPQPCIPITPLEWTTGSKTIILDKAKVLHDQSVCPCIWKGIIAILDAGQKSWFVNDEAPAPEETAKRASDAMEKFKNTDDGKKIIADAGKK